jgi:hypothetical protein
MRLKLGISDCYAWNFVAAFLVLRGAFFPRYGVSSLLGIAVLSEGFSACHACYQFLTGVPLVGLGFGEILEVVKLLRETLVHTFSGFRLEFTSREILRGRSATKQTPGNLQVLGLLVALNEEKGQLNIGIPLRRWGNRLTVALGRLQKEGQEFNLTNGASITKGAHQALLILRLTG